MILAFARRSRQALSAWVALGLWIGCFASALNSNRTPTDIDWNAVRAHDVAVTSADWGTPELVRGTRGYEDAPSAHNGVLYYIYVQNLPTHDFGPNLDPQGLCRPYGMDWHCGWFPRADLFTIRAGGAPVAHPLTVSSSPKGGSFLVGTNLYHHSDDPGNLYVAPDAGGEAVKLGTVNTRRYKDVNPWVDASERLLLFESNRPGAGDFDLYASQRPTKTAPWSEPVPLGFNTKLGDRMPFLHSDGYIYYANDHPITVKRRKDRSNGDYSTGGSWGPEEVVIRSKGGVGEFTIDGRYAYFTQVFQDPATGTMNFDIMRVRSSRR